MHVASALLLTLAPLGQDGASLGDLLDRAPEVASYRGSVAWAYAGIGMSGEQGVELRFTSLDRGEWDEDRFLATIVMDDGRQMLEGEEGVALGSRTLAVLARGLDGSSRVLESPFRWSMGGSTLERTLLPPAWAPAVDGARLSCVEPIQLDYVSFDAPQEWSAQRTDGRLNLTRTLAGGPVEAGYPYAGQVLHEYEEAWSIDIERRRVVGYRLHWRLERDGFGPATRYRLELERSASTPLDRESAARLGAGVDAFFDALRQLPRTLDLERAESQLRSDLHQFPLPRAAAAEVLRARLDVERERRRGRDPVAMVKQALESEAGSAGRVRLLVGERAPEVAGVDLDGDVVSIESLRGRLVLLNFWGST